MELKHISNQELIQRIEKLVRTERKITHLVLLHIAEIEVRKIYADMGYDGMYSYLTRGLGYSEGSAYRRLQSARLLRKAPDLADKIQDGSINLTQLMVLNKSLNHFEKNLNPNSEMNQLEVITKLNQVVQQIENKNTFETEKVLAVEFNLPIHTHEKIKPQQDDSVRIEITLTPEQFELLKQAQSLLSHVCPAGNMAEVIAMLAENFIEKKLKLSAVQNKKSDQRESLSSLLTKSNDNSDVTNQKMALTTFESSSKFEFKTLNKSATPAVIARGMQTNIKSHAKLNSSLPKQPYRKYISIHTKRELLKNANHSCEYVDHKSQQKCKSRFQLEIDHIQPLAICGSDEIKNLRVLCRTHNSLMARRSGLG